MKRHLLFIIPALLISLFIYLFYRTDRTLVNEVFVFMFSQPTYGFLKGWAASEIPLNDYVIFSLPEGLWVFCITITSKDLYIRFAKKEIDCALLPLVFSIGLELLQLFHITNGRFDLLDVLISIFFWFIAYFMVDYKFSKENPFKAFNVRSFVFISSYAIVYLAHVFQS